MLGGLSFCRAGVTLPAILRACSYELVVVAWLTGSLSLSAKANTFNKLDYELVRTLARTAGQLGRDLFQGVKDRSINPVVNACRENLFYSVVILSGTLHFESMLVSLSYSMKLKTDELYVLIALDAENDVSISSSNNLQDLANRSLATCGEDQFISIKAQNVIDLVGQVKTLLTDFGSRARTALPPNTR
jgi:hypothetical protein